MTLLRPILSLGRKLSRTTSREVVRLRRSFQFNGCRRVQFLFCHPSMTLQDGHVVDVRGTSSLFSLDTRDVSLTSCFVSEVRWGPFARANLGGALFAIFRTSNLR